jgi:hypothetical protein
MHYEIDYHVNSEIHARSLQTIGRFLFGYGAAVKSWSIVDMWYLFQGVIIFAVGASNIYWHWTPNGYLVGLVGVGAAYGATFLLVSIRHTVRYLRQGGIGEDQSTQPLNRLRR